MDLTDLDERYPDGIPENLQPGVKKFKELCKKKGIKSVKLMANFSLDLEHSLKHNTDVYKGVIVQAMPGYKLTEADKLWFHPQLTKTRSVYQNALDLKGVKVPGLNSSVGLYSTYTVDELGGQSMKKFTIVDTAYSKVNTVVQLWLLGGAAMRDVYSDFKEMGLQDKVKEEHDSQAGKPESRHEYVSLYKGANVYHFYNHVLRSEGETMVLQSPLMGYSKVSKKGDIASDMYTEIMDVNGLTQSHRDRIFGDCTWDENNIANTYIMRKGDMVKGEAYRMLKCHVSSNNIVDKLDAETILKLTPKSSFIPVSFLATELHKNDVLSFAASDEIAMKLLKDNWKSMLSKKFFDNGTLKVPRSMVEKYLV